MEWLVTDGNANGWGGSTVVRCLTVKAGSGEWQRNVTQLKKMLQKCQTFKEDVTKMAYCIAVLLLRYFAVLPLLFPRSLGALLFL